MNSSLSLSLEQRRTALFAQLCTVAQDAGRTLVDIVISADATAFEVHDLDAGDVPISWAGPITDLPAIMAEAGTDYWVTVADVWSAVDVILPSELAQVAA